MLDGLAHALLLNDAERSHLFNLAQASSPTGRRPRHRTPKQWTPHHSLQWVLDAVTAAPAFVRNGRLVLLVMNNLARAFYKGILDTTEPTPNMARFAFLDERAYDFYPDWEAFANVTVAILRTEAGRDPHNKGLQMEADPGLTLTIYTAEPESVSTERMQLLANWAATEYREHGVSPRA